MGEPIVVSPVTDPFVVVVGFSLSSLSQLCVTFVVAVAIQNGSVCTCTVLVRIQLV